MPTVNFPPDNQEAYNVPDRLFEDGLPLTLANMLGTTSNDATATYSEGLAGIQSDGLAGTQGDYHNLWQHFLENYWTELFDQSSLKQHNAERASPIELTSGQNFTRNQSIEIVRDVFKKMVDEFEGAAIGNNTNFLAKNFGITAGKFFETVNGFPTYSKDNRLEVWEAFLRNSEIGKKKWNIMIWAWEILLKLLGKLQITGVNKALSQRWMSQAQINSVTNMGNVTFKQQRSAQDFDHMHHNQVANFKLDILRNDKSNVQRIAGQKSTEASSTQQKMSETNTFITGMIDQLEQALRGLIK